MSHIAHDQLELAAMVLKDGYAPQIGRKLRSFDEGGTPPCDHPGVIAFLKA
ncbi:MAG: hypothetical protein RIS94_1683 [Pseudomonadota bacterium]|jgi:hypothetical protein